MLAVYTYIQALKGRLSQDRGATAVEYGLMVALIAVAIIATVTTLGDGLNATFQDIVDELSTAT